MDYRFGKEMTAEDLPVINCKLRSIYNMNLRKSALFESCTLFGLENDTAK